MLVPKIVASLRALRDVVITPVGPPMTGMSKTAVALVCSCLWVAPCMGAATPWVLLPVSIKKRTIFGENGGAGGLLVISAIRPRAKPSLYVPESRPLAGFRCARRCAIVLALGARRSSRTRRKQNGPTLVQIECYVFPARMHT